MNRTLPLSRDARFMRRAFDRAGQSFDSAAVLHRELQSRLLSRLEVIRREPQLILDVGAGTGHVSRALKQRFPKAQVIALDFSESMLRLSRKQQRWLRPFARVCADAYALPLQTASIDWIVSNAMLQCGGHPDIAFAEFQRVLKPGGLLSFSTFGPDTLRELRSAWRAIDDGDHVQSFIDMHDLGDALVRSGFSDPVLDVESFTLTYPSFAALTAELKATGSLYLRPSHRGLGRRGEQARLSTAYEALRRDGALPVSIEAVFGLAWQSQTPRQTTSLGGETRIPLSALRPRRS